MLYKNLKPQSQSISFISLKYLQHHTWSTGHSGQAGGSLQQRCCLPTSWLQPQLILHLQSFRPSLRPSLNPHHQREKYIHTSMFGLWLAAALFWESLLEAHLQLTVLWPQSRTFAPFESGLSVHRHSEPNLHHTGGVKGVTMGQCKKRKNETTQKHKNSTERRREMGKKEQGNTEHQSP